MKNKNDVFKSSGLIISGSLVVLLLILGCDASKSSPPKPSQTQSLQRPVPAPAMSTESYLPTVPGAMWFFLGPGDDKSVAHTNLSFLVPFEDVAEGIRIFRACGKEGLGPFVAAARIHEKFRDTQTTEYGIVRISVSENLGAEPAFIYDDWHTSHVVLAKLIIAPADGTTWKVVLPSKDECEEISHDVLGCTVGPYVGLPFANGVTNLEGEERSVVLGGRVFQKCRVSRTGSATSPIWVIYAQGVGPVAFYKLLNNANDKGVRTEEFPKWDRLSFIGAYFIPGEEPIEYYDATRMKEDEAGVLWIMQSDS